MSDITYIVNQDNPDNISGVEKFSQADSQLINQFEINTLFNRDKDYVELHIFNLADEILESNYTYRSYKELSNAQSAGKEGASILTIDPIADIKEYGYGEGDVKLLYHFLNDLFSPNQSNTEFFIQEISSDRTEIKLQTFNLTNEQIVDYVKNLQDKLTNQSYFSEFRLNFKNNNIYIGVNVDTLVEGVNNVVVVKLYEPLPDSHQIKDTLSIVELVSDSVAFEVDSTVEIETPDINFLRPANFNIDLIDNEVIPTEYFNYNELFSYPVTNTNSQIYSLFNEKGAELSIDHTDYSNFIHFSSAYERLANFKYKLQLLDVYSTNLTQINNATSQSAGITGSIKYYENLTEGILNNLDHYERFLYYESGAYSWPKSNNTPPFVNQSPSEITAQSWYVNQLGVANRYDASNLNAVVNTVPSFLRDDSANGNYLTFVHMIGQHFDNLWIYAKGVSDKYDADNRLNHGISKDLIGDVLKNFGVKMYTSNKSTEDLFSSFVGQAYQSGSEDINNYITGSLTGSNTPIQPSSIDSYQKEVYKRIYHNLPLLLKSKGTERGLRALINCFGIPSNVLQIKLYGGRNKNERPFYGDSRYFTSSLDKIRLDNTGSTVEGNTLSQYTSINKREYIYTDDLHPVEIGFSPTDNIDNYIISKSIADVGLSTFNIDNYIGDPDDLTLNQYPDLQVIAESVLGNLSQYDVRDFIRLIKFFDNVIFKMVKDFIPARSVTDTGIIIKPNLLNRSKAKSVEVTVGTITTSSIDSAFIHTSSIDTAFTEAEHGDTFGGRDQYTTVTLVDPDNSLTNFRIIQTPIGLGADYRHGHEETKFDGEFSGSYMKVTDGGLTKLNPYTIQSFTALTYDINLVSGSDTVCLLGTVPTPIQIIPGTPYPASTFFTGPQTFNIYTASAPSGPDVSITFPYTFTDSDFEQYDEITLQATASNIAGCQVDVQAMYASCSVMKVTSNIPTQVSNILIGGYDLTTWFTPVNSNIVYYVNNVQLTPIQATEYNFTGDPGDTYIVEARDNTIETYGLTCRQSTTVTLNAGCPITLAGDGLLYRYDNTTYFQTDTTSNPKTYIVCRQATGTTIKSLFLSGTGEIDTIYSVRIRETNNTVTQIYPGTDPNASPLWTGNETITLKYNTSGAGTWSWEITGGAFATGTHTYATYTLSPSLPTIEIKAFNNTGAYGTCEQTVQVLKPSTSTSTPGETVFCEEGTHYLCVQDPETNVWFAEYLPGVEPGVTCNPLDNPCSGFQSIF